MNDTIPHDGPQKQCYSCGKFKPATADFFYFYPSRKNAIDKHCIQCHKEKKIVLSPVKEVIEGMHQCNACEKFFPATTKNFHVQKSAKSGFYSVCKLCRSEQRTKDRRENTEKYHAYEQSRIEKHREANRRYHTSHIEEKRQAGREYVKNHREQYREYRKNHPEQRKATLQRYAENHPDHNRVHKHRRRALKTGNGGTHTSADIRKQYKNQAGKCYYCKVKVGNAYHIDHVIPLSKGGSNGPENLVVSCATCNLSKHAKIIRLL